MAVTGTSHFVRRADAIEYYRPYGYSTQDVNEKLMAGEIHLGPPPLKRGETLTTVDDGKRYAVVSP